MRWGSTEDKVYSSSDPNKQHVTNHQNSWVLLPMCCNVRAQNKTKKQQSNWTPLVKNFVFSSPEGHALCHCILKEYLPYDPHNVQIEGFCKILDNIDLFAVLATRSGKTSFLSMYILVVLVIKKDPSLCLTANFPDNPCILAICPTKYLEHQMVGAFNR